LQRRKRSSVPRTKRKVAYSFSLAEVHPRGKAGAATAEHNPAQRRLRMPGDELK